MQIRRYNMIPGMQYGTTKELWGFRKNWRRGARAVIDADRNLNRGRNAEALRRVFRRRGIGPVE